MHWRWNIEYLKIIQRLHRRRNWQGRLWKECERSSYSMEFYKLFTKELKKIQLAWICFRYIFLIRGNYLSALGCLSSLSESILEFTGHILHITHTSSSGSAAALSLLSPVKVSHLLCWVSTGRTSLLLDVEGNLSTTTAGSVGLVVSLSEWGCSLSLLDWKQKEVRYCFTYINKFQHSCNVSFCYCWRRSRLLKHSTYSKNDVLSTAKFIPISSFPFPHKCFFTNAIVVASIMTSYSITFFFIFISQLLNVADPR